MAITKNVTRRQMGLGLSALGVSGLVAAGPAEALCRYTDSIELARRIVPLPEGTYSTYPHANGFLDAHTCVIARPTSPKDLEYVAVDLADDSTRTIGHLRDARMYFAIASSGVIAVPMNDGIVLLNAKDGSSRRLVTLNGWKVLGDCDISPDGSRVLINRFELSNVGHYRVDMIDTSSGAIIPVYEADRPLDHAHFSPFDPAWVFFCDGTNHSRQRMWVWHPQKAPKPRPIFAQVRPDGSSFDLGHERAMFNKLALLVVAYPDSSATPRGLYEVSFAGEVRLVSESNKDVHCNVSNDGRWAVVSTLGPADVIQATLDLCTRTAPNWIASSTGYVGSDVMVVNMQTGARQLLFRATNAVTARGSQQPYEAQPAISPDGRWVLIKDAREKRVVSIEIDQAALQRVLRA